MKLLKKSLLDPIGYQYIRAIFVKILKIQKIQKYKNKR